eukprot:scaffold25360_cov122-Isochrysis_galbana.AAC.6
MVKAGVGGGWSPTVAPAAARGEVSGAGAALATLAAIRCSSSSRARCRRLSATKGSPVVTLGGGASRSLVPGANQAAANADP